MGEGHLQVLERLRPRELEGAVVVVEDEVAVQPPRDPVPFGRLAAVRRRVAEQSAADLGEVDVGLAAAAAAAAVAAGSRQPSFPFSTGGPRSATRSTRST